MSSSAHLRSGPHPPGVSPQSAALDPALAQILEGLPDGILLMDFDWRITFANQTARRISRLLPSDLNSKTHWELYPETIGTELQTIYHEVMHQRLVRRVPAFFYEPFQLWIEVNVLPTEGGISLHYRDISDQKRHEEDLRSSEERYRVLTELSPQSQWMANAQGLVLYANRRFLDYIGHDFTPRTGEEYIECFDPEDRARVIDVWTHSVLTGDDYSIDARLIRASDRAPRWWQLRALPVRDDKGVIQQWLGSATDIHEERLAADRLRDQYTEIDRQRRELETIYHASPIGMALYDPTNLRLLRINDRQAEIFRLPAAQALGKTYDELAAGVSSAHTLIRRAAAGENILNHDIEGTLDRRPDQHRFWNVNYSPIFNEDGTVRAIAAATIETTQQKRAEAALIQSEKLAAVGRMASSIAHEINNPLESVTNLIYIARTYAILPEVQNMLDLADQELRRVSIIANQTLRFHKQASSPREISCLDLYSTVLSLYEGRLRNSAISVEKRKRAVRTISCFEGDIRQVLNNLVGNAIDAMPTGGRLILRSRESTDWRPAPGPPRRGLTLTIADTGGGISAETRQRLFEPFFTTKGINGNGLGLWISADIIERHHGRLLLRSSQNPTRHGTVFSLFLPFPDPTPTTDIIQ
jgi:PAS domain S-box-containing protein